MILRKLLWVLPIALLLLVGCGTTGDEPVKYEGIRALEWEEIENAASGTQVRMFMWGGDEGINRYMDEWVAPRLKENYGINFRRTPMDIGDVLQKLMTEKVADSNKGTIDIIWLNGENFKNAKEQDLLWGPFVSGLPNFQAYVDAETVKYDFGEPTEDLEAPWGKVQFVYLYDSEKIANPPRNFAELRAWVQDNPGKFSYPEATDFTGNAFLRHLLYDTVGLEKLLSSNFDEELINRAAEPMWDYLNEIKPYLWRQGETYPQSLSHLDQLFSQGEVWLSMGYNEARAESLIQQGILPPTTKSFVMETGSIGNVHFLAIPFNSPNVNGALTTINFLLSPEAQLVKLDSSMWGENMVLDPEKLSAEFQQELAGIERGASVLSAQELQQVFQPEVTADYANWLKEKWMIEVVQPTGK